MFYQSIEIPQSKNNTGYTVLYKSYYMYSFGILLKG